MIDFDILNKPKVEVVHEPFEVKAPDPFDLERLESELTPFLGKVAEMKEKAIAHKIVDADSNALAVTYGTQVQKLLKALTAEANAIKAPYKRIVDGINQATKPFRNDLEGIKGNLRLKIGAYSRQQAEIARRIAAKKAKEDAERRRIEAEKERNAEIARQEQERRDAEKLQKDLDKQAEAAGVEPVKVDIPEVVEPEVVQVVEQVVSQPTAPVRTESGTASIIEKWTYRVTDIDKVPDKYLVKTVDKYKVNQDLAAGIRAIDGLDIFPDSQVRFRSK